MWKINVCRRILAISVLVFTGCTLFASDIVFDNVSGGYGASASCRGGFG